MNEPNLFSILFGRHAYGMEPEQETAWSWVYLLLGLAVGFVVGVSVMGG